MKLHWSPRSPFVRKVMIVAHERGVVDRITCVRTVAATAKPHAELMKDNPLSKIPTLVLDDGTVLYDSPVICEYLDALDGAPKLFPRPGQGAHDRAAPPGARRRLFGHDGAAARRTRCARSRPTCTWRARRCARPPCSTVWSAKRRRSPATPFGIGHIAIGCALSYLDFRFADEDWRKDHLRLANWHAAFAARPSVRATEPVDDS